VPKWARAWVKPLLDAKKLSALRSLKRLQGRGKGEFYEKQTLRARLIRSCLLGLAAQSGLNVLASAQSTGTESGDGP
jgi:hypothetical protein